MRTEPLDDDAWEDPLRENYLKLQAEEIARYKELEKNIEQVLENLLKIIKARLNVCEIETSLDIVYELSPQVNRRFSNRMKVTIRTYREEII